MKALIPIQRRAVKTVLLSTEFPTITGLQSRAPPCEIREVPIRRGEKAVG